jgi:flavin reductase (DIM6/NTAB) family NADH-FMN oxidoreductase RutF
MNASYSSAGYKFAAGSLTPLPSEVVSVPRVKECPGQLEAITRSIHALVGEPRWSQIGWHNIAGAGNSAGSRPPEFIMDEHYVDPAKWQPLIYNFRHYFGLGDERGSTFRAEV